MHPYHKNTKLGEYLSTAISGNDVLSSTLYVSGISILFAGVFAPLILIFVALILYLYQKVYREVVEALPVNGGAYNALLNGTTKPIAAIAGIIAVLSYMATAVISSKTAILYLFNFASQMWNKPLVINPYIEILLIIIMITILGIVVMFGIRDSAEVALGIFLFHIFTLSLFIISGILLISLNGTSIFHQNILATKDIFIAHNGLIPTVFLAFSSSLLGVAGFESAANFVEQQKKGVFRKTLKNMIICLLIFNPIIAFVLLNNLPIASITTSKEYILSAAGFHIGGNLLSGIIALDAFLVLGGAVLTSFIGVSGLGYRMSLDESLPSVLLDKVEKNNINKKKKIIISFIFLCIVVLLITKGNLLALAGVYTISFLSSMTLFSFGNLILRRTRKDLKRPFKAPFIYVLLSLVFTIAGIVGNIFINKDNILYFLVFFIPSVLLVIILIYKKDLVKDLVKVTKNFPELQSFLKKKYLQIISRRYYVFINHIDKLYIILRYIDLNENGNNITLIHCGEAPGEHEDINKKINELKDAGAFLNFNIDTIYIEKPFSPDVINEFASQRSIERNRIFIGSINETHKFSYDELGEVRIISS